MASDWEETILGELIEAGDAHLQTGPFGTALKAAEYSAEGVPLISVGEVRQGHFEISDNTPRVSVETTKRLPKFVLEIGDIVFGRKGGIDRNAIVHPPQQGWFLGSDGIRLRLSKKHNSLFFSYQMRCPATRAWLLQNCEGTTMPSLNQEILGRVPIVLPPLSEQKAIAHILGTLDDKIELNRRMNETLEAMARAIFKSWFVTFAPVCAKMDGRKPASMDTTTAALFPDCLEDSPFGPIPKGWRIGKLAEIATVIMGTSPSGDTYNENGTGTPLVNGPVEFGDRFPVKRKWTTAPTRLSQDQDLIFCVRGSTTGRRVISDGVYCLGRGVCAIRSSNGCQPFVTHTVGDGLERLLSKISGSVFPNLNGPDIKEFDILLPPESIIRRYCTIAVPLADLVEHNCRQSAMLAATRDALLPKLLSGQVQVGGCQSTRGVSV